MYRKQLQGYALSTQSTSSSVINKKWSVRQNILVVLAVRHTYSKFQIKVPLLLNAKHRY